MRRKFLRQNRDIARVNSAQSLRIRSLESECGRLLSDNLTLSGRILELEKELEESREAQRIADHALEIKARMETQLAQWEAMIQELGVEPAAKRLATTSPDRRRIARPRISGGPSQAARQRPRDSRSIEAMAAHEEGRLPPIHENKTYPRRTMRYALVTIAQDCLGQANTCHSHAELVAVCTEAKENNDSPDLGPPPTSRFVEDDPVKIDSPSRSTGVLEPSPKIKGEVLPLPNALQQPKFEPKKKILPVTTSSPAGDVASAKIHAAPPRQLLKAGSKRKFGDENNDSQVARALADKDNADGKSTLDKPANVKDLKHSRSGKDVAPAKNGPGMGDVAARPRKPLGEKSTNDDLASPKKTTKSATSGDPKKTVAESDRAVAPLKKKRVIPIKLAIPSLPPPPAIKMPLEPATPSADPGQIFSSTPETRSAQDNTKDTPPPTDISVHGETSRPSRRARPAISYAEPSLRDKMRRPTKELFDAVTGEGKFVRSSSAHLLGQLSSTKTKAEDDSSVATQRPQNAEAAMADEAARRPAITSPLLQKDPSKEQPKAGLPESVVTERRSRPSARSSNLSKQQEEDIVDPYEFQSKSPLFEQIHEPTMKGRMTKGMRRSMAATAGSSSDATDNSKISRKRASIAAPNKASLLESPMDDDSSFEASGDSAKGASSASRDRISRRRSMML